MTKTDISKCLEGKGKDSVWGAGVEGKYCPFSCGKKEVGCLYLDKGRQAILGNTSASVGSEPLKYYGCRPEDKL